MSETDKQAGLFMGLILMFHAAGMQHMGKTKNPLSDNIERNLEQAQFVIDTLDVLAAKTKGNLSDEETRFLTNAIKELKLNYVEELGKEQSAKMAEGTASAEEKKG